ncbi:hypothetical protein CF336_g7104 [Tilletia laevis]|uniref:non-specific serine/threonine protein kinase n=1 Tax=Tilletia caries TaxID=13290 RepID=A0ABN7J1Y3_9BASI|nr:hypothetical protein CF336_g7104 [Tilletia laevis]CAD6946967.1 unnamed protein product [Tilletia caries]
MQQRRVSRGEDYDFNPGSPASQPTTGGRRRERASDIGQPEDSNFKDWFELVPSLLAAYNQAPNIKVEEAEVWDLAGDVAAALAYVQDEASPGETILHRDLKPANILVRPEGGYKIVDFGLSRVLGPDQLARTHCGTRIYMAPEIFAAQNTRAYDEAVNAWALGITLYEVCTGKTPFLRPNGVVDHNSLVSRSVAAPPLPGHYSAELRLLVAQLLRKDPYSRIRPRDVILKANIQLRQVEKNM